MEVIELLEDLSTSGFKIAAGTLVTLAGDFHESDRKLHLLIGEINVTGT